MIILHVVANVFQICETLRNAYIYQLILLHKLYMLEGINIYPYIENNTWRAEIRDLFRVLKMISGHDITI